MDIDIENSGSDELSFEVIGDELSVQGVAAHPTCSNALVEDLFDGE